MHDHPKGGEGDPVLITTHEQDEGDQAAVLRHVLELHPTTLTRDELAREINGGRPRNFSEMDRIECAVRELAGTGLLHRPARTRWCGRRAQRSVTSS